MLPMICEVGWWPHVEVDQADHTASDSLPTGSTLQPVDTSYTCGGHTWIRYACHVSPEQGDLHNTKQKTYNITGVRVSPPILPPEKEDGRLVMVPGHTGP